MFNGFSGVYASSVLELILGVVIILVVITVALGILLWNYFPEYWLWFKHSIIWLLS